jgi:GT2 family glycosyltransferase
MMPCPRAAATSTTTARARAGMSPPGTAPAEIRERLRGRDRRPWATHGAPVPARNTFASIRRSGPLQRPDGNTPSSARTDYRMTVARSSQRFDVSVVIPTHNRWPLLRVALQTVLAQRETHVRVVVVDDCSTDTTKEQLETIADDRVLVLRHDVCRGVSAARNTGLEAVDTEWVAFLDDDDVFGPDHLTSMVRAARARAEAADVGVVYSGYIVTDRARRPVSAAPAAPERNVTDELLSANVLGPPSALLLRTEVVRDAGGFDERLSILADWDMWIRISRRYAVVRCPELNVGYMRHADNMHLAGDEFAREMTYFRSVHGPAAAASGRRLLGDAFPLHVAASYRARGRRILASAWYLRGFWNTRRPRHLALAAGVLLGERVIEMSGLRQAPGPPPAVDWLDPVQQLQGGFGNVPEIAG